MTEKNKTNETQTTEGSMTTPPSSESPRKQAEQLSREEQKDKLKREIFRQLFLSFRFSQGDGSLHTYYIDLTVEDFSKADFLLEEKLQILEELRGELEQLMKNFLRSPKHESNDDEMITAEISKLLKRMSKQLQKTKPQEETFYTTFLLEMVTIDLRWLSEGRPQRSPSTDPYFSYTKTYVLDEKTTTVESFDKTHRQMKPLLGIYLEGSTDENDEVGLDLANKLKELIAVYNAHHPDAPWQVN